MNVVLRENIIGVRVIRAFGKERHEEGRMGRVFTDYADAGDQGEPGSSRAWTASAFAL